jgi:O-acetyl-ADP-ribose deacetylase (regulator of RNase III)
MLKVQLVGRNLDMCKSWAKYFVDDSNVFIYQGDFFDFPTDCVVSPANSFGFMDGGLDAAITKTLGTQVQYKLRHQLFSKYGGELLVGQAEMVETGHPDIPYCISAPTMRVPMILGPETVNVYLATRADFKLVQQYPQIKTLTISGMGTGVGKVPFDICARQMKQAYDDAFNGATVPATWYEAQARHQNLYSDKIRDIQF